MKKILAGTVAICMVVTTFATPAFAVAMPTLVVSQQEDTKTSDAEALGKIILLVKEKFTIPEELTEFTYNHVAGNSGTNYWRLNWRDKDYKKRINVTCDNEGNITSYNTTSSGEKRPEPKFLKSELEPKAMEFVKQIVPGISDKIILKKSYFNGIYSGSYSYVFERVENGIRMPDNAVNVSLDYETGEMKSIDVEWDYNVKIPEKVINVSLEEAREKIGEKVEMKLKYLNKTENVDGKNVLKAYLVYMPNKEYVAVDAKTGEIYDTHDEYFSMEEYANDATMEDATSMKAEAGGFTEKELSKIEELKGLISKKEAIKIIASEKNLLLDENAKAVEANLYQQYDYYADEEKDYIWELSFRDPREVDYKSTDTYRAYASARVNAKTGKILSYYSSVRNYYDESSEEWNKVDIKYSSDDCRKVLEGFINSQESEKFSNTVPSEARDAYVLKYIENKPVYGGYSYRYNRVNEGIEYEYNGISGNVDGVTGKIYSYSVNWNDEIEFESPKGAMSAEEAYKAYSEKEGFELVYELNNKHYTENNPKIDEYYDYSELYILEKEARLVYRTDISPGMISPFTGEQMDYDGTVYANESDKEYTDISGLWSERMIRLVTDMGFIVEGDKFLPESVISEEELNRLFEVLDFYDYSDEEKELKESLTKLEVIKLMIKKTDLTEVAELEGIYKNVFADTDLDEKDLGFIAIAKGLKLVGGDNFGKLNPNKTVTRAEAVCMAINLAKAR